MSEWKNLLDPLLGDEMEPEPQLAPQHTVLQSTRSFVSVTPYPFVVSFGTLCTELGLTVFAMYSRTNGRAAFRLNPPLQIKRSKRCSPTRFEILCLCPAA